MPKRVLVLNGPNLNMLGIREPKTYGSQTLADIEKLCIAVGKKLGLTVECRQSNREGELCEWIQEAYGKKDGIVINPAGYSHTSVAIRDARSFAQSGVQQMMVPAPAALSAAPQAHASAPTTPAKPPVDDLASNPGTLTSPMVGTAYLAPEPGKPNFAAVGTRVSEGQTI